MGGPVSPLDTAIETERALFLAREENTYLRIQLNQLIAEKIRSHPRAHEYIAARRALQEEQELHFQNAQRNEHAKMPGSFHDAIKVVRILSVEIADDTTGFVP